MVSPVQARSFQIRSIAHPRGRAPASAGAPRRASRTRGRPGVASRPSGWSPGRGTLAGRPAAAASPAAPETTAGLVLPLQLLVLLHVIVADDLPHLLIGALPQGGHLLADVRAADLARLDLVAHVAASVLGGGEDVGELLALLVGETERLDHRLAPALLILLEALAEAVALLVPLALQLGGDELPELVARLLAVQRGRQREGAGRCRGGRCRARHEPGDGEADGGGGGGTPTPSPPPRRAVHRRLPVGGGPRPQPPHPVVEGG